MFLLMCLDNAIKSENTQNNEINLPKVGKPIKDANTFISNQLKLDHGEGSKGSDDVSSLSVRTGKEYKNNSK